MEERETHTAEAREQHFPSNWRIAADYDPNDHLMNLKGRDYLNVQNRLLWFIRDQRSFIASGLARVPYVIKTELVDMDRDAGFAHFKTYVRDVLGNEATMYGSESAKDFGDYAEKASTKSLGRALLALGYGTAFAPEMDEGDRVVDAPTDAKRTSAPQASQPRQQQAAQAAPQHPGKTAPAQSDKPFNAVADVQVRQRMNSMGIRVLEDVLHVLQDAQTWAAAEGLAWTRETVLRFLDLTNAPADHAEPPVSLEQLPVGQRGV